MKVSNYNFFYEFDKVTARYIAYNSFTNALALIEADDYKEYQYFQESTNYVLPEELLQELKKGGFIIDDEIDELELLKQRTYKAKYSTNTLGLTLAPTLNCNFRCTYCYEKKYRNNIFMTEEIQEAIISYIKSNASNISNLNITWYGGEPLLAVDIIEKMSEQILEIVKEYKINYFSSMVTNGYLLTFDMAKRLLKYGIKEYQITVDGDRIEHNKKRPYIDGSGTYDKIFDNLQQINGLVPSITLRVNIDKVNKNAIYDVCKTINEKNLKNVSAYPAPIRNTNNCYKDNSCLTKESFFELEYNYIKSLNEIEYAQSICSKYPILRGNICCADNISSYVIDPEGNMYKCWSDIGNKDVIAGNVQSGISNLMNDIMYIKEDVMNSKKCKDCKFLPICLGGCPYEKRLRNEHQCIYSEELLKTYLIDIAELFKKNSDNS